MRAPNDRVAGDVVSEERLEVRAFVVKFGHEPGLGAVWACGEQIEMSRALCALPRGVEVRETEVSARNAARDLGLSGVVARLSSGMDEGSDLIVATSGLAQGAGGAMSSTRVQRASLTGGAEYRFTGLGTAHS